MKVLLQNCKSLLFYRADGSWTPNVDDALDFEASTRALEFCRLHRPPDVQIVLKFSEGQYDLRFPVTDGCRDLPEIKVPGSSVAA